MGVARWLASWNKQVSRARQGLCRMRLLSQGLFCPRLERLEHRNLPSFSPAVIPNLGMTPYSAAIGDFNHDGKLDLVIGNYGSSTLSVLLGNGDGTFHQPVTYSVVANPRLIAVGDFNGDGNLDLATADAGSATVSVLLGNSNGTFGPAIQYAAGTNPRSLAVGDFNHDGKLDIVAANHDSNNISVLLGNGNGTFKPAATFQAGSGPRDVAVGDFNHDGKLDLAVANETTGDVSILLGNGNGTFQAPTNFAAGPGPWSVVVGDFNGDGKQDLAFSNFTSNTATVLLGNGNGTFQGPVFYPTGSTSIAIAAGDFNNDGKLDLATANYGSETVSVLPGRGDGTFGPATNYGVRDAAAIAVGDLNGDHRLDIVAVSKEAPQATILWNVPDNPMVTGSGPGGLPEVHIYDARSGTLASSFLAYNSAFTGGVRVALGDINGDGVPDIITAPGPGGGPDIRVFDGRTGAMIREFMAYDTSFSGGVFVAAGDVNGDSQVDIITGAGAGGGPHVKVFSGADGSVLQSFMAYSTQFQGGVQVAAGDINGDGKADVITGAGPGGGPHVEVFSGADGSLLRSFMAFASGFSGGVSVAGADVFGDGFADIIAGTGPGGGPDVRVFDGASLQKLDEFYANNSAFAGGVFVGGLV